jgi:hypothetical protein
MSVLTMKHLCLAASGQAGGLWAWFTWRTYRADFGGGAVDSQSGVDRRMPGPGKPLSRRKLIRRAAGVAAVGAAGTVLAEAIASPAHAAAATTTVEQGALAPAVVMLTDAPTISVDASQGNDFRVTLGASRTMGTPANPTDGQQIIFQVTQGSGGSAAITWATGYEFSTELPQPTLSTAAGQTDLLGFIYNSAKSSWLLAAFVNGFG